MCFVHVSNFPEHLSVQASDIKPTSFPKDVLSELQIFHPSTESSLVEIICELRFRHPKVLFSPSNSPPDAF